MSKTLSQIFALNPITVNAGTDLMYFVQSPYTANTDAAMTFANFSAQFGAPYTPAALTRTNDTNVTLTLGGTPATSLLKATSLALGWTGTLAVPRGGSGAASFNINGVVISNTTTTGALSALTLTDGQLVIGSSTGAPLAASLTAGSGITITPGHNSITISASGGGGVTSAQVQQSAFNYAVAGGTANTLTLTLSPAISSYAEPLEIFFQTSATNTGNATINVNGHGAIQLVTYGLDTQIPMFPNALITGHLYHAMYDATNNVFVVLNPSNSVVQEFISGQDLVYVADSGVGANAYVLSLPTIATSLGTYIDGTKVSFSTVNANSGASTINVNGIGVVSIVDDTGGSLIGGEILANAVYELTYRSTFLGFELLNSSLGGGGGGVTAAQIQKQTFTYVVDSGAPNNYVVTYTPAVTSYTGGLSLFFLPSNGNTGASVINVNGLGNVPIVLNNNVPLSGGEMAGGIYQIVYHSGFGAFILMNSSAVTPTTIQANTFNTAITNGGVANAYTATFNPTILTLSDGMILNFKPVATNTNGANTAPTLDPDGLGPVPIVIKGAGSVVRGVSAGALQAPASYSVIYDANTGIFCLIDSANDVTAESLVPQLYVFSTDGGAANAYNITLPGFQLFPTNPTQGTKVSFLALNSSTGPSTLTVNTFTAPLIYNDGLFTSTGTGSSLGAGSILAGGIYECTFDGTNWVLTNLPPNTAYDYETPSTGFSITIASGVETLILDPAGTLATGTITMPANPADNQEVRVCSSHIVTALTVSANAGQSIIGAPTTIGVGGGFAYIYNLAITTWFRLY